ncbi:MAG TPA: CbiX/SirB N-terminal domain-containing protein [Gemmatimonadaceae bacterium]|nr:CbiX/SirB N-terminal domain-containing protein [Gemmatimonadaceae bacterium]
MKSILLIDHGSRLGPANEMLACMAGLAQALAGPGVIVRFAHMELAEPSIADGVDACVAAGATEVIAFPYMLSPGRHATSDIPRLVAEAAARHPGVRVRTVAPFGVHEKLAEVILLRAGVAVVRPLGTSEASRCWHPTCDGAACGEGCRARPQSLPMADAEVAVR